MSATSGVLVDCNVSHLLNIYAHLQGYTFPKRTVEREALPLWRRRIASGICGCNRIMLWACGIWWVSVDGTFRVAMKYVYNIAVRVFCPLLQCRASYLNLKRFFIPLTRLLPLIGERDPRANILIPNHTSFFDPFLINTTGQVAPLNKIEFENVPLAGKILLAIQV